MNLEAILVDQLCPGCGRSENGEKCECGCGTAFRDRLLRIRPSGVVPHLGRNTDFLDEFL